MLKIGSSATSASEADGNEVIGGDVSSIGSGVDQVHQKESLISPKTSNIQHLKHWMYEKT